PLRERPGDLPLLAAHLLEKHARRLERPTPPLGQEAIEVLESHDWPGNVRELEGVLQRSLLTLPPAAPLEPRHLERYLSRGGTAGASRHAFLREEVGRGRSLEDLRAELERVYLLEHYRLARGDLQTLMERLGVRQACLYRWLRSVGIDIRKLRREGPDSYRT